MLSQWAIDRGLNNEMPRRPRNYLPGYTYHLVQRGVNRSRTFFRPDDYRIYLNLWSRFASKYRLDVHAYCLMSNHVHFLVTPREERSISSATRDVGANYTSYINIRYERTGTLWEGRHRSSLIDSEQYVLSCYRYIELNPVRAGMVSAPADYPWSSYQLNTRQTDSWLIAHPEFVALAKDPSKRIQDYKALFLAEAAEDETVRDETQEITTSVFCNRPLADDEFLSSLESKFQVVLKTRQIGRPKRGNATPSPTNT